jgi:Tfp pilus assembly protein PilN
LDELVAGAWQDFDLLRRRRQEQGIEAITPAPGRGLLWRGSLIGAGLLGVGALGWLGLFAWVQVLATREQALLPVAAQHQQFEARLSNVRQQLEQLSKANQALADGILSIPSGALLLSDLAALTPAAVQLTSAKQEGGQFTLSGQAAQPNGLRAINAFQLALERSPLFAPDQVQLVKVQEQQAQPQQAPQAPALPPQVVLSFELKATLVQVSSKAKLSRLQALGPIGLLRRLQTLQAEGLLR